MKLTELTKHPKKCEYAHSGHDLWTDCTCSVKFNKKPFKHWQEMAREHVVETILRGALQHTDERSLPGALAKAQLLRLANDLDAELVYKILQQRDQMMGNLSTLLNNVLDRWPHVKEAFGFRDSA
jgi:hypothetical protein